MPSAFFREIFPPEVAKEFTQVVTDGGCVMAHCTRIKEGPGSYWYLMGLKKAGNELTATVYVSPNEPEVTRAALTGHVNRLGGLNR